MNGRRESGALDADHDGHSRCGTPHSAGPVWHIGCLFVLNWFGSSLELWQDSARREHLAMTERRDDLPDYYELLGVLQNATREEITAAYHLLARRHHPDMAPEDQRSSQKFKAINEAYEVLSDPARRRQYDQRRQRRRRSARRRPVPQPSPARWGATVSAVSLQPGDVMADLPVAPEEVLHGSRCPVTIRTFVVCRHCLGISDAEASPCRSCGGTGHGMRTEQLELVLPAGAREGTLFCLQGRGNELSADGLRGDLYLRVVVRPSW